MLKTDKTKWNYRKITVTTRMSKLIKKGLGKACVCKPVAMNLQMSGQIPILSALHKV